MATLRHHSGQARELRKRRNAPAKARGRKPCLPPAELAKDPESAAQMAGLRYASDTMPGIRRKKAGKGFTYVSPNGATIRDPDQLARIRSLAIPPAYSVVWICPIGRDLLAVAALKEIGPCRSPKEAKSNILRAIDQVSEQLNNTRAICRKYYIHPAIFETYQAGTMLELLQNGTKEKVQAGLESEEAALIRLLRHQLGAESTAPICNEPATV